MLRNHPRPAAAWKLQRHACLVFSLQTCADGVHQIQGVTDPLSDGNPPLVYCSCHDGRKRLLKWLRLLLSTSLAFAQEHLHRIVSGRLLAQPSKALP